MIPLLGFVGSGVDIEQVKNLTLTFGLMWAWRLLATVRTPFVGTARLVRYGEWAS